MGAPRILYVVETEDGDDSFFSAFSSIDEVPADEAGSTVHRYKHTGSGQFTVSRMVAFPEAVRPAAPVEQPPEPARRRGRPRRKPEGVSVQTRDPIVEQAAASLPEPASTPAAPAPQQEPAPVPEAPAPGSPAALTELLAKYAEKFGTVKLLQHIRDAGGKRVRDLDPRGRAQLLAALEKEMAG